MQQTIPRIPHRVYHHGCESGEREEMIRILRSVLAQLECEDTVTQPGIERAAIRMIIDNVVQLITCNFICDALRLDGVWSLLLRTSCVFPSLSETDPHRHKKTTHDSYS